MPMTLAVTREVAPRVRGFLASVMVEVAPGVYAAPRLNPSVRRRVMEVLGEWQADLGGAVTVVWQDQGCPGGLAVHSFGVPTRELVPLDGLFLSRTGLDAAERETLEREARSLKTERRSAAAAAPGQGPDLEFPADGGTGERSEAG
jgi:CRISPR-associated protein Cas2